MATKTPRDLEIRARLADVLWGEGDLRDFYRWFVPETWSVSQEDGEEAVRLTYQITHLFADFTSDVLTPREMRRELEVALSTYVATETPWNLLPAVTVATSSLNDITEELAPVFVVGSPREAARASCIAGLLRH